MDHQHPHHHHHHHHHTDEDGLLEPQQGFDESGEEEEEDIQHIRMLDDEMENDDARSISTIIPHELEPVDEEDEEEDLEQHEERKGPIDEIEFREHGGCGVVGNDNTGRDLAARMMMPAWILLIPNVNERMGLPGGNGGGASKCNGPLGINTHNLSSANSSASPCTRSGTLSAPNSRSPPSSPLARPQQQDHQEEEMMVMERVFQLNA